MGLDLSQFSPINVEEVLKFAFVDEVMKFALGTTHLTSLQSLFYFVFLPSKNLDAFKPATCSSPIFLSAAVPH